MSRIIDFVFLLKYNEWANSLKRYGTMAERKTEKLNYFRARLAKIVEVGASDDFVSRGYDFWITGIIVVNLTVAILSTFEGVYARYGALLDGIEAFTAAFFALDYVLRLVSAKYIVRRATELGSLCRYAISFSGLIDLLSFLPYYLPVFFPDGAVAFRIFRVIRIFRLFRINAYYDSLNAITEVLSKKKQQLLSSVFIILILMLAASLCMYSVEHTAQPEVFENAFSGIWWSASTLLTVGYGDIYPVTTLGKALGTVIAFLGVGMVAIPTGIISAGFVEQYSRMQDSEKLIRELDINFIKIRLQKKDAWVGKTVAELKLPHGMILTAVYRGSEVIIPRGDLVLQLHDTVILGAEPLDDQNRVYLKELSLGEKNPWNGQYIRDLDISRQSVIVMIRRNGKMLIPKGETRLKAGDRILLHTKRRLPGGSEIDI